MTALRSVVLAGGGSAGHVEPALALAETLRRHDPGLTITALGTPRGLENRLVPARGFDLELIPPVPLPRKLTPELVHVPLRLRDAVRAARAVLERTDADVVVGFGGYVALPAYLAARGRRTPFVVHEANARPGLANRIGARLTRFVAVATPGISLPHARLVGMPLRQAIRDLDRAATRSTARAHFGLEPERPTLLVTGGSQGARSLNVAAVGAAPALSAAGAQVLHAVGARNTVEMPSTETPYVAVPYIERMELAYAAADMALCRAGMMTVSELTAVGLPAAYVPLPHGNGEQRLNAQPVVQAGGGLMVADADLTPEWIRSALVPVLTDPRRLAVMSEAARRYGRTDGDEALRRLVYEAAGE